MKPIKTLLACAIAAALVGCGADSPASLVASAKDYMAKRDYNASVIQLKNALQQEPENPEARYLLGLASLEQGDAMAAQIELDKAAQLGFASDELVLALARTALVKGETDRVLKEYGSKTLAAPKSQAELRALVGTALLARNQRKEAEAAFQEALRLDSTNMRANLGTARLAAVEQRFPEALTRVDQVLGTTGKNLEALLLKAELHAVQAQPESAEKAYRSAIEAAPAHVIPRFTLVNHLLRHRELDKAAVEVAALEKAAPKDPYTAYAKALVLVDQRQFAAAKEALLQVLKVAPDHVPTLILAGMAALHTGALQEAESYLRKAAFNAPQALNAKRLLAATHLRMGKTQLALSEVEDLLKVSQDSGVIALAGEAHLANGDVAKAAQHYEKAKSLAPNNAAVQTRLALIRFAAGDPERALSELESASNTDPSAYQADLALITAHLRRREADKALEAVAALAKKQPNNPLTHNLRGGALILKQDFAGARASFEQALRLQPTYMPAVSNLAQLDVREKKPQAAKKRYEAVLKKEPNNEQALLGLAVLLRISGANGEEIQKLLKQAVAANPTSARTRAALINFHVRNRDLKGALAAAQEAHAALPNDPAIVRALGGAQIAAGEPRQAVASFTRLVEMQPKSPEPIMLLARAHVAAKQPEDAIRVLRAALVSWPDLASAHRDIAAIYVSTGRHEEALREARAVQSERPKDPYGHVLEGEIYIAQKKLDLAERTYRAALKKFDLPALVVRTHGVMAAAGNLAEADALAEDWIKRHPKDAVVLTYLGERDIATKRYESAVKRYEAGLQRLPDNTVFLNNLAWVESQLKRPSALEHAERAHALAPDNPNIMDTLGTILVSAGQAEKGLELLGRAAELAPQAHQIRLNFAKALLKAERKAAARKDLEQLATLDSKLPQQQEAAKLLGEMK